MTYVDERGDPLTVQEWIAACQGAGMGRILAESVVPTEAGDRVVRTKWFGTVIPEIGVQPFGTGIAAHRDGPYVERGQYDTMDEALSGHIAILVELGGLTDGSEPAEPAQQEAP